MTNSEIFERYLKYCAVRDLSKRTIQNYATNISCFIEWYQNPLEQLNVDDLEDYTIFLRESGTKAPSTVRNHLRDIRAFIKFAQKRGWIGSVEVSLPKVHEPEIIPFTDKQLKDIYEACKLSKKIDRIRDYTIMRLMEETGLRLSECFRLDVEAVNLVGGTIMLTKTKNKKGRTLFLTPTLRKEIAVYLDRRSKFLQEKRVESTALWVVAKSPNYGKRYEKRTFQYRLAKYGEIAGINIRVSPHTFRHTFAKNFLSNGGDVFTLQELLGHSTLEMTRRYVRLFDKDRQISYLAVMSRRSKSRKV